MVNIDRRVGTYHKINVFSLFILVKFSRINRSSSSQFFEIRLKLQIRLNINVQLIFPSSMDAPGVLMLNSVRKVLTLAGIKPESIQFKKEELNAGNIIDALTNEKKCPVTTVADFTDYFKDGSPPCNMHAMVIAGALKGSEFLSQNSVLANEWFIKCKNSYGNDPNQPGKIQYPNYEYKRYSNLILSELRR